MHTWHAAALLGAATLSACASETIVHELNEKEANRIIELLAESDIVATKGVDDTGREVSYSIAVPAGERIAAIKLLNRYELPRRKDNGYVEVFGGQGGLIPTDEEERAKSLAALEGELERQLKLFEGILDVQVQLVVPEEDALRTTRDQIPPTTASVTIKFMPGGGGAAPLSESQVRAVVAAGVENLTPDNVVVVMAAAVPAAQSAATAAASPAAGECVLLGCLARTAQLGIILGVIGVFLLLGLGLFYMQLRLNGVRGRLLRLQAEVTKARRKPIESVVAEA